MKITLIKPSSYGLDGYVERFRLGYMPNSTLWYIRSMTRDTIESGARSTNIKVVTHDEMIERDLDYLNFKPDTDGKHLVALVGTQSHQLHRAADIAALAVEKGALAIIGGPHVMSCDTSFLHKRGVSFCMAEAELVWDEILRDAANGQIKPVYGEHKRTQDKLESPVLLPPPKAHISRHVVPMGGVYTSRGCPFSCDFCMIYKFAGHSVRSQSVDVTLKSIANLKKGGVKIVIFTGDNTNKMRELPDLCDAMVEENLTVPFLCQCDSQIGEQEWLLEKMARAGCKFIMVGAESFNRDTLKKAGKTHNHPDKYAGIASMCKRYGVIPIFSNIIGFPDDTRESVREHVRKLREVSPLAAYFFIMTPAPGSDQYAEYKRRGLITEKNLDRFDATYPCWAHPHLSHQDLLDLTWESYTTFHNYPDMIRRYVEGLRMGMSPLWASFAFGYAALLRRKARQQRHPLSGGLMEFEIDHVSSYMTRRQKVFGYDHFPLPDNLEPTEEDKEEDRSRLKAGSLLSITGAR